MTALVDTGFRAHQPAVRDNLNCATVRAAKSTQDSSERMQALSCSLRECNNVTQKKMLFKLCYIQRSTEFRELSKRLSGKFIVQHQTINFFNSTT